MGDGSKIEWTDATWNPVRGCSRISEGCRNCYAERVATRFSGPGMAYEGLITLRTPKNGDAPTHGGTGMPRTGVRGTWNGQVRIVPEHLADPLRWRRPRRIFVNSMSDLFHENLSNEEIAAVFAIMAAAPQHTFQVLTKRPARALEWFRWVRTEDVLERGMNGPDISGIAPFAANELGDGSDEDQQRWAERLTALMRDGYARAGRDGDTICDVPWPLPNVWLGVSVEDQQRADERIPLLLETLAAIRFLSCEPLLGPVDLKEVHGVWPRWPVDTLSFVQHSGMSTIDWVIVGSESGPGARPMDHRWAQGIVNDCAVAGVPVFVKQIANEHDRKGGDPAHWPHGIWPREFPEVRR